MPAHRDDGLVLDEPRPVGALVQPLRKIADFRLPGLVGVEIARREQDAAEQQGGVDGRERSEEHTSELQSLMRNSYAVFCLKKKNIKQKEERQAITEKTEV